MMVRVDETACVNCLLPNCEVCNGDNVCSRCAPGYILSNNICVFSTCKFPYLECDPTNSSRCASCVSLPFVLTPNNGVCLAATPQLPGLCHSQHLCLPQLPGRLLAYQWPLYSLLPKSPVLELLQLHDLHYLCCRIPHPTRILRPMHPGCSSCALGTDNSITCSTCMTGFFPSGAFCLPCPSSAPVAPVLTAAVPSIITATTKARDSST